MKYDAILSDLRRHGDTIVGPPEVMRAAEQPDARVGRYVVVAQLGQGGAGTVYRAWDPGPGRFVALKVLNRDTPAVLERFKREAQIAARLRHPGIVPVHEVGEDAGRHFIAMELVDGATADARRMRPREAADVVRQAALAIHAAHEQGVIHRDVKPSNILIDRAGRAYVSDFGLARWVEASRSLTDSDMVMGTPGFMSPEQVRDTKRVDARADVYGLGATLYRLSTGRVPHAAATTFETLKRTLEEELAMPRGVLPRDLEAVIQVAMAKEPGKRYATARALAEDLKRFLEGDPVSAHPPSFTYRVRKRLAKRKLVAGLGAVVVALAVVLGIVVPQWRAKSEELALQAELKPVEEAIKYARPYLYVRGDEVIRRLDDVRAALKKLESRLGAPRFARHAAVWTMVGSGRYFVNDYVGAEAALLEAHRLSPRDGWTNYYLGRVLLEQSLEGMGRWHGAPSAGARDRSRALAARAEQHFERAEGWTGSDLEKQLARAFAAFVRGQAEEVSRLCREGLTRFGDSMGSEDFHLLLGLMQRGDESIGEFDLALERRPHYPRAYMVRAMRFVQSREFVRAEQDFSAVLKLAPTMAEAYASRAGARSEQGDHDGAIADADRALALRPLLVHAYLNRGSARYAKDDVAGAVTDYDAALRIDPHFAPALTCRGAIRKIQGDWQGACADFEAAMECDSADGRPWFNRGIGWRDLGDFRAAERDFSEAVRREYDLSQSHYQRAFVRHKLGAVDGAVADLDCSIAVKGSALAYAMRGFLRTKRGDARGALADLDESLRLNPGSPVTLTNRGNAKLILGDPNGAIVDYDKAVRLDPKLAEALLNRARAKHALGRIREAIEDLDATLRLRPDFVEALEVRAIMRADVEDWGGAREDYDAVLRLTPASARALAGRGRVRLAGGDAAGSLADFDAALRLNPADYDAIANRGGARLDLGDRTGAREDFSKALKMAPPSWPRLPEVRRILAELKP
jgi:tetratricopeptide (TPR) repeat protein/predicted Ser/Thr protein kinase